MANSRPDTRPRPDEGYIGGTDEMDMEDTGEDSSVRSAQRQVLSDLPNLKNDDRERFLLELVASMTTEQGHGFLRQALAVMPTSVIARVDADIYPRLHINPANVLPLELSVMIMHNLSPADVIRASATSHSWRRRGSDSLLWRSLFLREGWMPDIDAIEKLLVRERHKAKDAIFGHRRKHEAAVAESHTRKRLRESGQSNLESTDDSRTWHEQNPPPETDTDQAMEGIEASTTGRTTLADMDDLKSLSSDSEGPGPDEEAIKLDEENLRAHENYFQLEPPLRPSLTLHAGQEKAVNWLYLYKQRRRLEANWDKGRYRGFQLPRAEFPDEGHGECVYTVQFVGDYLVSGSRDKTIKVWDLNTQRCIRTMKGQHDQSVLCLQFDPKDDIIVSGGSDSFVVIWKFSTGEVIKKMTDAHTESVLNLRFDDRYLITCSKDKTIKIWNRHQIMPDDPIIPLRRRIQFAQNREEVVQPYTLLSVLEGHGAAVNAIQIYKDTIVSASGDRTVRMWDIQTGDCIKDFNGHFKGIACVQFDGRRIVSGSSDNTVRIFDAQTKGEVACLQGHMALVRTVQARFADRQISNAELERLAQETQDKWASSMDKLAQEPRETRSRYGLDSVHDIRSINAKIPHGGGGNRWSRIVSGSYDETLIIWKKDSDGRWMVNRRLHQDEILNHPDNQRRQQSRHRAPQPPPHVGAPIAPQARPAPIPGLSNTQWQHIPARAANTTPAHQQPQPVPFPQPGNLPAQAQVRLQAAQRQQQQQAQRRAAPAEEGNNRVFKLQFDSRRIVCCSQNQKIVIWDFANGDTDLIEASKYFAETD